MKTVPYYCSQWIVDLAKRGRSFRPTVRRFVYVFISRLWPNAMTDCHGFLHKFSLLVGRALYVRGFPNNLFNRLKNKNGGRIFFASVRFLQSQKTNIILCVVNFMFYEIVFLYFSLSLTVSSQTAVNLKLVKNQQIFFYFNHFLYVQIFIKSCSIIEFGFI